MINFVVYFCETSLQIYIISAAGYKLVVITIDYWNVKNKLQELLSSERETSSRLSGSKAAFVRCANRFGARRAGAFSRAHVHSFSLHARARMRVARKACNLKATIPPPIRIIYSRRHRRHQRCSTSLKRETRSYIVIPRILYIIYTDLSADLADFEAPCSSRDRSLAVRVCTHIYLYVYI